MAANSKSCDLAAIFIWILLETVLQARSGGFVGLLKKNTGLLACVIAGFLLMTVPVERYLADTPSRWSIVDYRISGALRAFTSMSEKEIMGKEDR